MMCEVFYLSADNVRRIVVGDGAVEKSDILYPQVTDNHPYMTVIFCTKLSPKGVAILVQIIYIYIVTTYS